jgi:HEPN domain-containing protein
MDRKDIRRIAKHTFADQQSNEESWYRSAVSYYEGANVLWQHKDSIHGGMRVFLTNAALPIELLLKAIAVAKVGIAAKTHELPGLARGAGIAVTKNQEATLELLGEVLRWSGRYPVPNNRRAWDHYYNDVHEKHVIREREGNVGIIRANRGTFPSIEVYKKLWDLANQKWGEIHLQRAKIKATADPSTPLGAKDAPNSAQEDRIGASA